MLCPAHHHLVHEGGYRVETDGGSGFSFHTPEDTLIDRVPTPGAGDATAVRTLHDVTIDSRTAIPNWNDDRLDLHYAVNVLLLAEEHAARTLRDVPAETSGLPEG